jgi:hypothetical protein
MVEVQGGSACGALSARYGHRRLEKSERGEQVGILLGGTASDEESFHSASLRITGEF